MSREKQDPVKIRMPRKVASFDDPLPLCMEEATIITKSGRSTRQRRLVRIRVENLSGRCRSSLGMTLTLKENQGSVDSRRGLEGTTLACTRGPEQWPKVLAV